MKIIRTYAKGENIIYQFPTTDKKWSVQFANNIKNISLVGKISKGDTNDQIQEINFINANLSSFDDYCFNSCNNLNDISLLPNIKSIGDNCFNECRNIKTISYEIYDAHLADESGKNPELTHIGNYAFSKCMNMQSITIPESINDISQIDPLAFADSSLTSITFLGITSDELLGG